MSESEEFYVNPIHLDFAFRHFDHPNVLEKLFELLNALDEIDRNALISLTAYALGDETGADGDTQEEEHALRYEQFKQNCRELPVMSLFVAHAVVLDILNIYRDWSDSSVVDRRIRLLESFADPAKNRPTIDAEAWSRRAEESRVQKQSDLQVARRRYNEFCEKVVRPLLEMMS